MTEKLSTREIPSLSNNRTDSLESLPDSDLPITPFALDTEYVNNPLARAGRLPTGQWAPGVSGNPEGARRRKPITAALEQVFTPEECLTVAKALLAKARKGSVPHIQEAANRLEGRVTDADGGRGNVNIQIVLDIPGPDAD